jgi:hypothetical protein
MINLMKWNSALRGTSTTKSFKLPLFALLLVISCLTMTSRAAIANCDTYTDGTETECSVCADFFYITAAGASCTGCEGTCGACNGDTNADCTRCHPGDDSGVGRTYMSGGLCVASCPTATWGDFNDGIPTCYSCIANCNVCSTNTTCDTCVGGRYVATSD